MIVRNHFGLRRVRRWTGFPWIAALLAVLGLAGCQTQARLETPEVSKGHYMDEGATIVVSDALLDENQEWKSLPELLKKTSEDLEVESEKNTMLAQQLMATRDTNDRLQDELEKTKRDRMSLSEEILALKNQLAELEVELKDKMRESKELLEMLVNLKIEKNNMEKELIRIKIASLTGEG